mmetsp:Transcript_27634/g.51266  ORF Transcript_27634/g.51266 Transcript_27634/m.51266 type:complete len:111 (+) Transcript_27634:863-1195(+)
MSYSFDLIASFGPATRRLWRFWLMPPQTARPGMGCVTKNQAQSAYFTPDGRLSCGKLFKSSRFYRASVASEVLNWLNIAHAQRQSLKAVGNNFKMHRVHQLIDGHHVRVF